MERRIKAVITAATGDRVVVGEMEVKHALRHFALPEDIFLELLERILKDPTEVFLDDKNKERKYYMFYRLNNNKYIVAVVKSIADGNYFASMYTTGGKIRTSHKSKFKKVKI